MVGSSEGSIGREWLAERDMVRRLDSKRAHHAPLGKLSYCPDLNNQCTAKKQPQQAGPNKSHLMA